MNSRQTGHPRLTGNDGNIVCAPLSELAHRGYSFVVSDGQKEIDARFQESPGEGRGLTTGQTRHDGIYRACRFGRTTLNRALIKAISLPGFDHHECRSLVLINFPEIAADPGGHSANAPLQEDMGKGAGRCGIPRGLLYQFGGDGAVTLHHITRDNLVTFV
ncbi:hypothetical protein D3C86_1617120 [compost metagenome]